MDALISLAIYVGKLEARIESLEKGRKAAPEANEPDDAPVLEEKSEEREEEKKIMEGMENIFAYEWPPKKKEDGEE